MFSGCQTSMRLHPASQRDRYKTVNVQETGDYSFRLAPCDWLKPLPKVRQPAAPQGSPRLLLLAGAAARLAA